MNSLQYRSQTKWYEVAPDGSATEKTLAEAAPKDAQSRSLFRLPAGSNPYMHLEEAAITTTDFPSLLKDGMKAILFDAFVQTPTTFQTFCRMETSNHESETYLKFNSLGTIPIVPEGQPYPEVQVAEDAPVTVKNYKRGEIFSVTREMLRFDRYGQIRQFPNDLGESMKQTMEASVFGPMCTAGNYTSGTTENDIGANTAATTFSAGGLKTAWETLATMKDKKSGRYLGVRPDTLIVAPGCEWAAKMLLLTPTWVREHGATTAEVYGTGQDSPIRGLIRNLIVSPYVGTKYGWVLMQAGKLMVFQEVDPIQLVFLDSATIQDEGRFVYDKIRYRVDAFWGADVLDQRFGFYSSSTTTPAVG